MRTAGAMKQNRIWISWGFQRRSFELSREFDAAYFDISGGSQNRYRRYLQCIPQTVQLLRRSKAETIFAQNPSLVLSIIVALGSRIFRYRYVNDLLILKQTAGTIAEEDVMRLNSYADPNNPVVRIDLISPYETDGTNAAQGRVAPQVLQEADSD